MDYFVVYNLEDARWISAIISLCICPFTLYKIHLNRKKKKTTRHSSIVSYYIIWMVLSIIQRCLGRFPSTYRSNITWIYCWQSWMESFGAFVSFQLLMLLSAMPYIALFHTNYFNTIYIYYKRLNICCILLISMILSLLNLYFASFGSLDYKFNCSNKHCLNWFKLSSFSSLINAFAARIYICTC